MLRTTLLIAAFAAPVALMGGCNEDGEIDICSDDIDCNDGFICEITGEDDGICIEDINE